MYEFMLSMSHATVLVKTLIGDLLIYLIMIYYAIPNFYSNSINGCLKKLH